MINGPLLGEKPGLPLSENWNLNSVVKARKFTPFIASSKLGCREKGWEEQKETNGRSQGGGCHILFLFHEQEIAVVIYAVALQIHCITQHLTLLSVRTDLFISINRVLGLISLY